MSSSKTEAKVRTGRESAQEIADWYMQHSTDADPLSLRAHILLRRAFLQVEARNPVGKESDYTSGRFNVLSLLYRAGKRGLLMTEIAAGINISITNLPKLMDDLAARKLITRVRDKEDGRKRWAQMTAQGRSFMESEIPRATKSITAAWDALGNKEKQKLIDVLETLLEGLNEPPNGSRAGP